MRPRRLLVVALIGASLADELPAQRVGIGPGTQAPKGRPSPWTFGTALGLAVSSYEADTANARYLGAHAVGFDMQVAVWWRRIIGVRLAAGVEGIRGPDGPDGHPATGSIGVAGVALALRAPPPRSGWSIGVDLGTSTVFEPTYSYSYTEGNTVYVYPSTDVPFRSGPYLEGFVRRGGLFGWQVTYRRYFAAADPTHGRLLSRLTGAFSVSR